jgi:branched-chain amino acid transport system permease protein
MRRLTGTRSHDSDPSSSRSRQESWRNRLLHTVGQHSWILAVGGIVAAILLPVLIGSDRWTQIFLLILIYAGLASGLNLLVGFTGLLDLGYIAFYAVGAYVTSLITVSLVIDRLGLEVYTHYLWWLPFVDMIPAAILAAFIAALLGYPTLRTRGDYLAIMTLALGEIVRLVATNWTDLTRGTSGIPGIPPFAFGNVPLYDPLSMYYVSLALVALLIFAIWRVAHSHLARVWMTIREDELVAESMGIRAARFKSLAYMCGGLIAGSIGVIYAHTQGFINPDSFALELNFVVLALVILGGSGTILGPIIGAILWVGFDQFIAPTTFVQNHPEMRELFLASLVLVILILAPNGLVRRSTRAWGEDQDRVIVSRAEASRTATPDPSPSDRLGDMSSEPSSILKHIGFGANEEQDARLDCRELTCAFGGLTAVKDANLSLYRGEILGIIGPNGAGKTTLINMLSGIQAPTSGTISVDGSPVRLSSGSVAAALGICRTFQFIRILKDMTVLENLLVGAHRHIRPGLAMALGLRSRTGEIQQAGTAVRLLEWAGLAGHEYTTAGTLSYGDQRRLEIARALMTRPRFLLLDEPAAGMNATETQRLAKLLSDIRAVGIGIALIEHDMTLLMNTSDRVLALDHGEIVTEGAPDEVRSHPKVIEAYLGPEPQHDDA